MTSETVYLTAATKPCPACWLLVVAVHPACPPGLLHPFAHSRNCRHAVTNTGTNYQRIKKND